MKRAITKFFSRIEKNNLQLGQTLIELVVAVMIIAVVLTGLAAVATVSLRDVATAKSKLIATRLAQEAIDYYRFQRNQLGWSEFYRVLQSKGAGEYCLDDLPVTASEFSAMAHGDCGQAEFVDERGLFYRQAEIELDNSTGTDIVVVRVIVTWQDSGKTRTMDLTQNLTGGL